MKGRLFYIHWNPAEAETNAANLRNLGYEVDVEAEDGARAVKHMTENPPDVVVISLTRLPSHGRETARALQTIKTTRDLPILFVGGTEEAIERTRAAVPGVEFAAAEAIELELARMSQHR